MTVPDPTVLPLGVALGLSLWPVSPARASRVDSDEGLNTSRLTADKEETMDVSETPRRIWLEPGARGAASCGGMRQPPSDARAASGQDFGVGGGL